MRLGPGLFLLAAAASAAAASAVEGPSLPYGGDPRVAASAASFFRTQLDANGDGAVSVEEMRSHLEAMDPHAGAEPTSAERAWPAVAQFDADADGLVTLAEFDAALGSFPWPTAPAQANLPAEIHLAPAASPDAISVTWVSASNYSAGALPEFRYGTTSGALDGRAAARSLTYNVGTPGFFGAIHTATATGLEAGAKYYYRVGADGLWSDELFFVAAAASRPANVSFAMYGDMGVIPFGWAVTKELVAAHAADPFDAVLHVGDIAYAGITSKGEYEPTWDLFGAQVQPLAQQVPYATSVGNHEKYFNYTSFKARWQMPGGSEGGTHNFWFSYTFAGVHVTSMSTEHPYTAGSPQMEWLERDMASQSARGARWRVLAGHRPLLCSDADEYSSHRPGAALLAAMEPLLLANAYDLVVNGHMHCSELALPSVGGRPVVSNATRVWTSPGAPAYVTQGNAGALIAERWVEPRPVWSAYRAQEYGYGRANFLDLARLGEGASPCAANATDALSYKFTGKGGAVREEFWVCK